jgi:hypothetical protein
MGLEDFVDEEEVGEEGAQVDRRVQIVDHLRADRRLRQHELNRRLRVLRVVRDDVDELVVRYLVMTPGRPLSAASAFFRYSRAWRPVSLSTSEARPWEAYARKNSYASSMVLIRAPSSATASVCDTRYASAAGFAVDVSSARTGQRLGSWCSRY